MTEKILLWINSNPIHFPLAYHLSKQRADITTHFLTKKASKIN